MISFCKFSTLMNIQKGYLLRTMSSFLKSFECSQMGIQMFIAYCCKWVFMGLLMFKPSYRLRSKRKIYSQFSLSFHSVSLFYSHPSCLSNKNPFCDLRNLAMNNSLWSPLSESSIFSLISSSWFREFWSKHTSSRTSKAAAAISSQLP